jgi:dienelactone hydrolase
MAPTNTWGKTVVKKIDSLFRTVLFLTSVFALHGCATFENHKGEKFPFSVAVHNYGKPSPTIIVSHGSTCRSPQDDMWAKKFQNWGFNAIVVDHCSHRNIGSHVGYVDPPLKTLDRVNDFIVIAEWAKVQPWHSGKVAVFGISRGGQAVLRAANDTFLEGISKGLNGLKQLDVYMALYPNCELVPSSPLGPTFVMHGEADNLAQFPYCQFMYNSVKHTNFSIKSYPDAHHGFDVDKCDAVGFTKSSRTEFVSCRSNAKAANAAFIDARRFLEQHLKN